MAFGTTSGTFNFGNLPISDVILESFSRCGIHGTGLTRHHIVEARRSMNLLLVDWNNRPQGINLWKVIGPTTINLVAGQATYTLPITTTSVLDVYFTTVNGGGTGVNIDRIMLPISRTMYAMLPNKLQAGTPTVYWYERLNPPTITFWQPPQTGAPQYVINYYALQQIQDAIPTMAQIPDAPDRFLDALCADHAVRMAEKFAPQRLQEKKLLATESWNNAISRDQENAPTTIQPTIAGYYPR